ncbi:Hypothetical protein CAP_7769 [Chondromyces apiculatus DSM 436]|uniref:Uncharacterized protein n=1 Tax=Chondromyces apiculatus DSM 436 TaxID=1192034 RepID=A0A017SZS2_9BACT|nr:Hypothetical protein CAP_7769 [Chondromyces apiculatus DSM 436]
MIPTAGARAPAPHRAKLVGAPTPRSTCGPRSALPLRA